MTTDYDEQGNAAASGLRRIKAFWPTGPWNQTKEAAYLRVLQSHPHATVHAMLDRLEENHEGRFPPSPAQVREQLPAKDSGAPTFIPVGPPEDNAWIVVQPNGRRISADTYGQAGGSRPDAREGKPHLRVVE